MPNKCAPGPPPRLAISGSAGVGKTSLGERLSARFSVPFVPEGMRALIEEGLDLHTLSLGEHRALFFDLYDRMAVAVGDASARAGGFVCDRSPVDFAAFWLYYGFGDDETATADFFDRVRSALEAVEVVILLPWGQIELERDGIRSANPWVQLHYQSLLEGLLHHHLRPRRLLRPPAGLTGLDDRVAWVEAELQVGTVPPTDED